MIHALVVVDSLLLFAFYTQTSQTNRAMCHKYSTSKFLEVFCALDYGFKLTYWIEHCSHANLRYHNH